MFSRLVLSRSPLVAAIKNRSDALSLGQPYKHGMRTCAASLAAVCIAGTVTTAMMMTVKRKTTKAAAAVTPIARNRDAGSSSITMTPSSTEHTPDGNETSVSTKVSSVASATLQKFKPINSICRHVCGVHLYAHDPNRQLIAHHYCSHLNDKIHQCVIYDSDKPGARLIGIEYIITEDLFEALPPDEKKFWHSHQYEVSSGQLIAPNVPLSVETKMMGTLVSTYGKTIHTWQVDRGDTLPLGAPQLMMSPTADGQIDEELLTERDHELNLRYNTARRRKARRKLKMHLKPVANGADQWTKGDVWQLEAVSQHGKVSINDSVTVRRLTS